MSFEGWKQKWLEANTPLPHTVLEMLSLLDRALTAGYQRKVAEQSAKQTDEDQAMIEDLVENVDEFKNAWAVTFIESIEGKKWDQLSPKQKAKVEELWEDL